MADDTPPKTAGDQEEATLAFWEQSGSRVKLMQGDRVLADIDHELYDHTAQHLGTGCVRCRDGVLEMIGVNEFPHSTLPVLYLSCGSCPASYVVLKVDEPGEEGKVQYEFVCYQG